MANNCVRRMLRLLAYIVLVLAWALLPALVIAGPDRQDDPPELVYGQTIDERIDETQPSLFYAFEATEDDVITITMVATEDGLDPFIVLNTVERTPLATDDNSGGDRNARLTFVIPATGRYLIQATNAGGVPPEDGGAFTLNLTAAMDSTPSPPPEASAAPPTTEVTATTPVDAQNSETRLIKLVEGTQVQGALSRQVALRYYWFEAQLGDQVTITPDPAGGFQPLYVLYSAGFVELDRTSEDALQVSIPDDDIYFLGVALPEPPSTGGDYSFGYDRLPNPATSDNFIDIAYGETVNGTIDDAVSAVTYRFRGSEGDGVTIAMTRTGGDLNSYLYLLDDSGQLIFEDNDSGSEASGDARISYTLPADGAYLIVATRLGQTQGTTSGGYQLALQSNGETPASPESPETSAEPTLPAEYATLPQIAYGETINGEISNAKFMDFYIFEGMAGDDITIELESENAAEPNGLDPLLILLDAGRIPLAENDDIVEGEQRDSRIEYTLPANAYYAIVATRFEQDEGVTSGPYTLTLTGPGASVAANGGEASDTATADAVMLDQLAPTPLASGTPQQGAFGSGADLYVFTASEGELIDITATADPGLDTVLILADENLNEIASNSTGALEAVSISKSGRYLVMVGSRFGPTEQAPGGYILALTQAGEEVAAAESAVVAGPRALTYGDTVNGSINDDTVSQLYTFTGTEGERVRITMEATPGSELDCYLELQTAGGTVVDANDDIDPGVIRDSQIVTDLPADGTYTVIASRYVGPDTPTTSGSYRLSLELLDEDAVVGVSSLTTPLRYGQTEVGELGDEQYLSFYVFDGAVGDVVTISVDQLSGNLDSVLHLYRSEEDSWMLITSNDDSPTGGTYDPLLSSVTLPQTGKYLIAVSRYGMERESSSGTFALTLTLEEAAEQ